MKSNHSSLPGFVLLAVALLLINSSAQAFVTAHPVKVFDHGLQLLNEYHGDEGKLNEAKDYFLELIARFSDSPLGYLGMSRISRVEAYLYGNHYNMRKIRDEALPFALKALELGPSLREVHENYAYFEKIYADYHKNETLAREYLRLFPDSAQTYYVVANLMYDQEEYDQALKYYLEVLSRSPSEQLKLKTLKRIGMTFLNVYGQPEKALGYFHEAIKVKSDCPDLNEYFGVAHLQLKDYQTAIDYLHMSQKAVPSPEIQYYLLQAKGYLAERDQRWQDAISFLEQALKIKSQNSTLHYTLGNLYYKTKDFELAYSHFQKVIAINPQNTSAYFLAGRAATSLGMQEAALDYFRRYLQLESDTQEAQWIRENILDLSHK